MFIIFDTNSIFTSVLRKKVKIILKNEDWIKSNNNTIVLFCRVSFANEPQDEEEANGNELLVELEGKDEKSERETNMWFSKVRLAHLNQNKKSLRWILTVFFFRCAGHLRRTGFGRQHRRLERTQTNPAAAVRERHKEESGRGGGACHTETGSGHAHKGSEREWRRQRLWWRQHWRWEVKCISYGLY